MKIKIKQIIQEQNLISVEIKLIFGINNKMLV